MSDVPVLSVGADPSNDRDAVERAASILRAGGLVAVPTETVYGLAARADDGAAVARIYSAKGRPAHNPLIVHVASLDEARALATEWPGSAQALAEALWPGPLTLVVRRRGDSLAAVSAGRDTIAVRVPDHPVLLEVLRGTGLPLAAPSANRSNHISPTRAEHVLTSLEGKIDLVLDGGPCSVGIESSVVDVTGPTPRLLRPGGTPVDELRRIAPDLTLAASVDVSRDRGNLSPGLGRRHYSPTAPMRLVALRELAIEADRLSGAIGLLTLQPLTSPPSRIAWSRALGTSPEGYAAQLYDALHDADASGLDHILVELPPTDSSWSAIHDRLERAATSDEDRTRDAGGA